MNNKLKKVFDCYVSEDREDPYMDLNYLERLEIAFLKKYYGVNPIINLLQSDFGQTYEAVGFNDVFKLINEIALNINYLPIMDYWVYIINTINKKVYSYKYEITEDYKYQALRYDLDDKLYLFLSLLKFNDNRAFYFWSENMDTLSEIDRVSFIEDYFCINSELSKKCLELLLLKVEKYKKEYLKLWEQSFGKNYFSELKMKKEKFKSNVKFSLELHVENFDSRFDKGFPEELLDKLKIIFKDKGIGVVFRTTNDYLGIGSFSKSRISFDFDLFTNEKITAKEIAYLFGNNSILYLSGNTNINGKDVFYENAAWYRSNEDMPVEDRVFFNDPKIAKFRVYNVINND